MNDTSNRSRRGPDEARVGILPANAGVGRLERQLDQQRIARRAYEIYESRRRTDGQAEEDWFQAEAECAVPRRWELKL
jgi:hypothetical protein